MVYLVFSVDERPVEHVII